jgi:electron transfer flavoprotein beta subunit
MRWCCGRESVDEAASQVHTRLAEILDLPQANVVSALKVEDGKAEAKRDIEGGSELMEVDLPAVISVQKGINEVRYPSLRLVMKASRHPIKTLSLEDLGLSAADIKPFLHVEAYLFPKPRQGGRRLTGEVSEMVSDLIQYLRAEVKAI